MGIRLREPVVQEAAPMVSSSSNKALLIATMSIVGSPVEVYIRDGSIYSGIFFTASMESGYGVILKKAKMMKKGIRTVNMSNGDVIDTLVVLPGDLVQVVAKGIVLPSHGVLSEVGSDDAGSVLLDASTSEISKGEAKSINFHMGEQYMSYSRQEDVARLGEEDSGPPDSQVTSTASSFEAKKQPYGTSWDYNLSQSTSSVNHCQKDYRTLNVASRHADSSDVAMGKLPDTNSTVAPSQGLPPKKPVANGNVKESKLNPEAKIFSPTFATMRSPTPQVMQNSVNITHLPSNPYPLNPPKQDLGIRPLIARPSFPMKFFPHGNLTAASGPAHLQYAQQIATPITTRPPPVSYGGQFQQIHPGVQPYSHTYPQNSMVGRQGQFVYLHHPTTHDMAQGIPAFSHAPHHHPMLSPQALHVQKLENVLVVPPPPTPPQMSVTPPPLVANEHLSYAAMPSHIPPQLQQHSLPNPTWLGSVFSSHGPYSAKFL